jgi:uncharacterized protein (DUF2235 family)
VEPAKNIALFIDGTWNEPSRDEDTNVRKLFHACFFNVMGPSPQITYYLPGVGTDIKQSHPGMPVGLYGGDLSFRAHLDREMPVSAVILRSFLGGSFGLGTAARIKEAYGFLSSEFDRSRGDKVFIFGFSRGAFAARSLAGFVSRVGIILRDKPHLIEAAYRIYEEGTDPADTLLGDFLREFAHAAMVRSMDDENALPIHLIGVWDTVGALGLPWRLRKFSAKHTEYHQFEVPPTVLAARHVLALHELRKPFELLFWFNRKNHRDLQQVWFPGAHADVGGGYGSDESGLSDNALRWMGKEATTYGLRLDPQTTWMTGSTGKEVLHHEIRKWFWWLSPVVRPQLQNLLNAPGPAMAAMDNALYFHESVARHLRNRAARDYGFLRSSVNKRLEQVDELAMQLFVRSRLLGLKPKS